ncbi:MAG: hypothetical protein EBU84_02965 [Actinobacteria bacterium]|nr:hypothetical protein [Actinomycetota bacterium]
MNYQTERAIEDLLETIDFHTQEADQHQAKVDRAKEELMNLLDKHELETVTVGEEGSATKVTVVRATTIEFDEEGLKKSVSDSVWRQITKVVLDKKALEDAVARGKVPIETVADHSKEKPKKPYLKITAAKEKK